MAVNRIDITSANMRNLGDWSSQIKNDSGLIKVTDEMIQKTAEAKAKAEYAAQAEQVRVRVNGILGLDSKYGLNAQKVNYFTENLYSTSVTHNPKTGEMEYIFSGYATYSKDRKLLDSNGVMSSYLNAKGNNKYLDTPVGQMEVFLDLDDDNDQYGVGTLDYVGQLINLDINKDGILNSGDEFFDKIKLRGFNSNGEEVILKLTDVYNSLDLTKFVNTQKDVDEWNKNNPTKQNLITNGTSLFAPELSYKQLNEEQQNSFREMFKNNADESGWIDFRKTYKDEYGLEQLVYGDLAKSLNLAYNKVGINGVEKLELLRFNVYDGRNGDLSKTYVADKKERFLAMYEDYYNSDDEGKRLAIRREFQVTTGMKFSEEKFKEFYNGLNNPATATKYANALKDTDSVVAMKLNDNGILSLKFDSGRTIDIALKDLFVSDGEFNVAQNGEIAGAMSETQSVNESELDFNQIGTEANGGIVSLAELGVEFIRKETFSNGRSAFVLTTGSGKELVASTLYKIRSVEDMVKFAELEEKDKLRGSKFEMEM